MKRPIEQGRRYTPGSILDPMAEWRDWRTYHITGVTVDGDENIRIDLASNLPKLYAPLNDVLYIDWRQLNEGHRNAMIDNTSTELTSQMADAEELWDRRQQKRVLNAVKADDRVVYRRALAPESFLIYSDARDELDQLRRGMRREDVPRRVVVDDTGTETQRVPRIRRAIVEAQGMPPSAARDAHIRRLRVTEQRLVQDWNRLLQLATIISQSAWVRDTEPWGPLYNPRDNAALEAVMYHIMTAFPDMPPLQHPPRSVTYNIIH